MIKQTGTGLVIAASGLPVESGCRSPTVPAGDTLPSRLLDLLTRYNVNDYAASVRVFALKPKD